MEDASPVMLPKINEGVRQEIIRNNKVLYRKKREGFDEAFKAASDIPIALSGVEKDQVLPWMSYNISLYLTSLQKICGWVGVEIKMRPYIDEYERENGLR